MIIDVAPKFAQAARTQQAAPDRLFPERRPAFAAPNSLIYASKRKSSPSLVADRIGGSGRVSSVMRSRRIVRGWSGWDLLETTRQQRLAGQSRVARAPAERGALADGLAEARALDIIYALMSPEVHQILTAERLWNADQCEHWLARTLAAHSCHQPIPDNHDNTRSGGISYIAGATERPSHPGRRFSPGR